jgi:adenylate kinase family enzyme
MRLRIVGVSGSGKTHLARAAASRLGVPLLELDAVFWDAGWTYRDLDEARAIIAEFAAEHPRGWVVEGNWSSRLDGMLEPGAPGGADAVVWLDYPRALVMRRIVGRTLRRGVTREELWHGNRERPGSWLRWAPERNIVRWAWVQHPVLRERMRRRMRAGEPIVRLADPRAATAWLSALPGPSSPPGRSLSG